MGPPRSAGRQCGLQSRLDLDGGSRRRWAHEVALDAHTVDNQPPDTTFRALFLVNNDLVGRPPPSPAGGESWPGRRQYRVDAKTVELWAHPENPLRDRGEVPRRRSRQPGVLRLAEARGVAAGDHLWIDVRLTSVHVTDRGARRRIGALVVVESGLPVPEDRLGNHDPRIDLAEDAPVLLVAGGIGGDLSELEVVPGERRLHEHDPVLGREPVLPAREGGRSLPIGDSDPRHDAHALRLCEDLSLRVRVRADDAAERVVGPEEPLAVPPVFFDSDDHPAGGSLEG